MSGPALLTSGMNSIRHLNDKKQEWRLFGYRLSLARPDGLWSLLLVTKIGSRFDVHVSFSQFAERTRLRFQQPDRSISILSGAVSAQ